MNCNEMYIYELEKALKEKDKEINKLKKETKVKQEIINAFAESLLRTTSELDENLFYDEMAEIAFSIEEIEMAQRDAEWR